MTRLAIANALLVVLASPYLLAALYLGVLALLARAAASPARGRSASGAPPTRFAVLVPAHDEAEGIGATIASLQAVVYPRESYRVIVVADNCTDGTAARARASGAIVLERTDPERRGKGYALSDAFDAVLAGADTDAVVVVDADSTVSPDVLAACDAALQRGAQAIQVDYGVRNPSDSWRTRLLAIGFTLFHGVRSLARELLGLSCGLRGNGMCFRTELLRRVPPRAYSIVEDVEYGAQLALAGVRVAYVHDAHVWGEMPAVGSFAGSQRARWEEGRREVTRRYVAPLLRAALARRSLLPLDLALDLLVPPLSRIAAVVVGGGLFGLASAASGAPAALAVAPWAVGAVSLAVYVARGCFLTGHAARSVADLAWAPAYVTWKIALRACRAGARQNEWVRTTRQSKPAGGRV
jgi:1,2-diacylglycerol 3-beta-glucosyltransferase